MTNFYIHIRPQFSFYVIRSAKIGLYFDGKIGCNEKNVMAAKRLDHAGALSVKAQFENVDIVGVW